MGDALSAVGLRLAIIAVVLAGVYAGRIVLRNWQASRRSRVLAGQADPQISQGEPTVLLFSGTLCSDCIRQKETLAALNGSAGHFRLDEVMAAKQPALAGRFGVQSVPATVILRGDGKAIAVNYGYVDGDVIASQLAKAG